MSNLQKTPIGRVRGLGSAKEGVGHFIGQRVTALAMIVLVPWFLLSLIKVGQMQHAAAVDWLANPLNAVLVLLTVGAAFYHMRLGLQTVVEDYIQGSGLRQAMLILNTFVALALFVASAYAVLTIGAAAR